MERRISAATAASVDTGGATTLGYIMHIVATYDAGSWKLYKNGILISTLTTTNGPGNISDVNVWLGRSNWASDNNVAGTFEEFRIYSYALSPQQVWESFRNGRDMLPSMGATPVPYQVLVDPAPVMTTGSTNFAVEWNTNGNLEGWAASQTSAGVSGGLLSGTASGTDASVSRSNFGSGPDLDLGWNDFVELRIQVPATYTNNIQIFYGTTYTPGFDGSRVLTIPASMVAKDGLMHTYRIDAGLEPQWRSTLRDLRIDPVDGTGSSGMAWAIDYLRVGDEPNAVVYNAIVTYEMPANGGSTPSGAAFGANQPVATMESKHFVFHWNNAVTGLGGWTADMPHGTLRNAEEVWQNHAKVMGYIEPCFRDEDRMGFNGTTRGKINISTWHSGYWAGTDWDGSGNRIRFNATPDGLRVDAPSWVIPHELMHVFQFVNNAGGVPGEWQESQGNYARERWLEHYQFTYPDTTSFDPAGLKNAHMIQADGRDQYLRWTSFLYMDANPDNLPDLGDGTTASLYRLSAGQVNPFNLLDGLSPVTGKKNVFGHIAQHGATLNYPTRPMLRYWGSGDWTLTRFQYTDLEQRPDDPTWWRVPYYMAPQQGGYTIHQLVVPSHAAGYVVTVNFRPLPDSGRGADCRGGFTIVADDGSERYSAVKGNGTNSVTLAANENTLYFCVAGTPDNFEYTTADETVCSYRSAPGKSRFPYELQVTGATPKQRDSGGTAGLVQHANGGGWKSTTANVAATAYIGPNARVWDYATVSGNARIEDYAVVQNNAVVTDNAVVSGHGWVRDNATIRDNGKVRDWATVFGNATIAQNGRALEHCEVSGTTTVQDTAVVKGSAWATDGWIHGNAIVDGNYWCWREIYNGFVTGHQPYVGVPDTFITALPAGLYAAYNFASAHDSRVIDQYGVTDGFTQGSPTWVASDAGRTGLLSFNGTSQFVNLDRNVADQRDFTFAAWIKPASATANQAVLWLGSSTTKRLYFTPNDGAGHAKFAIVNGGAEQTLTTSSVLPVGVWTHVAVTLDGSVGVLYTNGVPAMSALISIRPDQVVAANTATNLAHNYLCRSQGNTMAMFNGSLDDVGFYSSAMPPASVATMSTPAATVIGSNGSWGDLGNTKDKAFDGNLGTFYDAVNASGDWVGLDLGTAKTITQIKYCPRSGFAFRMTGGVFQGSSSSNFNSATTLYTITGTPTEGVLTSQTITNSTLFRYVRYIGPSNGYCDVAELAFITSSGLPPATPAGLAATPGVGQAQLTWNAAAGAASYNIKRSTTSGGSYTTIGTSTVHNFTDTTATGGTTYYYVVSSVNDTGESANSGEASATPATFVKLTGTVIGSDGSWGNLGNTKDKAFDGSLTTFYDAVNASGDWVGLDLGSAQTITQIKYCPRSGFAFRMTGGVFQGSSSSNFNSATTLYTITDTPAEGVMTAQTISDAGAYRYVRYLGPNGGYCDIAELEFDKTIGGTSPPVAPTSLVATPGNNQVGLMWNASSGATSYNVKRSTTSGSGYTTISSPTGTSYTDTTAVNGTTYYYVVSTVNLGGESANSGQAAVTPTSSEPVNLSISASGGTVTISWPEDHIGWRLRVQTNLLATGLSTNWNDVPNSTMTNNIVTPFVPNSGSIFYLLTHP